jgi:hypothetical protein
MTLIHTINIPQNIYATFMLIYDNIEYYNDFVRIIIFTPDQNNYVNMKSLTKFDMYSFNTWDFITLLYKKNLITNINKNDNQLLSNSILEYMMKHIDMNNFSVEYANYNDKYGECNRILSFSNENDVSVIIKKLHFLSKNYNSIRLSYILEFINKILLFCIFIIFFIVSFLIIKNNLLK